MEEKTKNTNGTCINSIVRASEILNLYRTLNVTSLGITEISRNLKLGKTTVFRVVKTLESIGWLIQDGPESRYSIGPMFVLLSSVPTDSMAPNASVLQEMRRLCRDFNEDIVLTTIVEYNAVCIEKIRSQNALKIASNVGRSIGMTRGASGKTLLAYLPAETQDKIIRMERGAISKGEKSEIMEAIELIREKGYGFSTGECDEGISALAAPIFGKKGTIQYSLSVVGEEKRMEKKGLRQMASELVRTSSYIEDVLRAF